MNRVPKTVFSDPRFTNGVSSFFPPDLEHDPIFLRVKRRVQETSNRVLQKMLDEAKVDNEISEPSICEDPINATMTLVDKFKNQTPRPDVNPFFSGRMLFSNSEHINLSKKKQKMKITRKLKNQKTKKNQKDLKKSNRSRNSE